MVHDGWVVRGGVVGGVAEWVRGEEPGSAAASGFTGSSPAYDVALARHLAMGVGERRRLALVEVTEPVGAVRTVRREWARVAWAERDVECYEVTDPDTGAGSVLHVAGDVLLSRAGPGPATLATLT